MHTLILNSDYQPISVLPLSKVDWKESIKLTFLDRVNTLYQYDKVIKSPSLSMTLSSVSILKEYVKIPNKVTYHKDYVFLRDNYKCQYCGLDAKKHIQGVRDILTLDHYIPKYHGGKTNYQNIITACIDCNNKKSHHQNMKPYKLPHYPSYQELARNRRKYPISIPDIRWNEFLKWDEKLIILE